MTAVNPQVDARVDYAIPQVIRVCHNGTEIDLILPTQLTSKEMNSAAGTLNAEAMKLHWLNPLWSRICLHKLPPNDQQDATALDIELEFVKHFAICSPRYAHLVNILSEWLPS